jgi:hypothetical protein
MAPTDIMPLEMLRKLTVVVSMVEFILLMSVPILPAMVAASPLIASKTGLALSIASTVAVTTPTLLLKKANLQIR